jgi:cobalt-zinc-cadmium resistance protein CzcA
MRFNELITGVRADLAIKIFGEDLDVLYDKALEVEKAIQGVEGAADITVEKVAGLPQMSVKYDRRRIAKYGLNVEDLNNIITMGFAGKTAGTVFEGEKQFDMVVRFDEGHRRDIQNIETATVQLPDGNQLPLTEFADISYTKGPAKISRDNTKRRIVVGVNVRGRDLESVVKDVQEIIGRDIKLPIGYTVDYGGQFENLRTAKDRLMIAVPIALLLIFVLLYFAFNSVKEALIIYSAIPMSAVGGVILLYIRDMPFSISAGVGFIALFGIAVLNGIVLIEEFKELKAQGISDINKRIIMGTKNRLRPVLLTASAAALGFLPMAISTSAGAEVQRPLATVVVGGLISATLLTLIVLPVLYALFDRKGHTPKIKVPAAVLAIALLLAFPTLGQSQDNKITVDQAVEIALQNNLGLRASSQRVDQSKQLIGSAIDIDKTEVYYNEDAANIAPNNLPINTWGISQSIQFPTIYGAQRKVMKGKSELSRDQYRMDERMLTKGVHQVYNEIVYWQEMLKNYTYLDSLYLSFERAANRKFEQGESNYLEKLTAETKKKEVSIQLNQIRESIQRNYILLNQWLQYDSSFTVSADTFEKIELLPLDSTTHPMLSYYANAMKLSNNMVSLEKQKLLPDLNASVFRGTNNGGGQETFSGFQVGVSIPLWFGVQKSKIAAAKTGESILEAESDNYKIQLIARYESLLSELRQYEQGLTYYESTGKKLSDETLFHANRAYQNGEIDFLQYAQLLENAKTIESNYLQSLFQYNMTVLEVNYLMN